MFTCERCGGHGVLEGSCNRRFRCPQCRGTGKQKTDPRLRRSTEPKTCAGCDFTSSPRAFYPQTFIWSHVRQATLCPTCFAADLAAEKAARPARVR